MYLQSAKSLPIKYIKIHSIIFEFFPVLSEMLLECRDIIKEVLFCCVHRTMLMLEVLGIIHLL